MTEFLQLKKSNCKNCYKCIRHCPVKSIRFSAGQANIISDECILCGQCFVVCPQNAKSIVSELEKVKVLLMSADPVIASIAPSFVANYDGVGIHSLEQALKKLGFAAAEETAIGATIVKKEYEKMLAEAAPDLLISSSCPSVNLLIQKHYPEALKYLAPTISPMLAHGQSIKQRYRERARTVFIGPCIAKKDEAERYPGSIDAVLTFSELSAWLEEEGLCLEPVADRCDQSKARLFPTAGGILKTMACTQPGYTYLAIDGVENCIGALKDIGHGGIHHCFIEMSACQGSCIGGPVMEKFHRRPVRDYQVIQSYAGDKDFSVAALQPSLISYPRRPIVHKDQRPETSELNEILHKMGKTLPEHELNCGCCGYNSCRDKAVAIYQGKADMTMCLPFLKEKAESFSANIINNTPNGIMILNEDFEIQQINNSALRIMNMTNPVDLLGEPVLRIMNPGDFLKVRQTGKGIYNQRTYLPDYQKYVDKTIIHDQKYQVFMCFMRDVTAEVEAKDKKARISKQTIEIADKVVDNQMRIVQEIASLLGETTAETKIALTKLKDSIKDE